jgi:hypothetical protein
MVIKLDKVVPFGRLLSEYQLIFHLTPWDIERKILDVAGGPASFNAEMHRLGYFVTSIDPIYELTSQEIQQRFDECVDNIIEQVKMTPNDWVWNYHKSPEDLRSNRKKALDIFLADYEQGKAEKRYIPGALPDIPINEHYDLVLCSHFLFLYSEQLDYDFHRNSIFNLLKQSHEVRIFPLLTLDLKQSPHLAPIREELHELGYYTEIFQVDYELQRGGNEMLKIQQRK